MLLLLQLFLKVSLSHRLQKQWPLRASDFDTCSFLFHHTVISILAQISRDSQDRYITEALQPSPESQPQSPDKHGLNLGSAATAAVLQGASNAPGQAPRSTPPVVAGSGICGTNAQENPSSGTCHRYGAATNTSGAGRRLARINTRGNSASGLTMPAMLHDCGASVFDKQTPREVNRIRCNAHDSWVHCRSLARAGCLAWPGVPDGSGCREAHIDIEGIRLQSARAYTCARAISDRTCTTYTAANSSTAWLPLVNSANPDLLESVLTNAPCPFLGAGPSFLLSGHQDGKLHVYRHTQQCTVQVRSGTSGDFGNFAPMKAGEKCMKGGKKFHATEGKETRARAQEKLRSSTDAQPAMPGQQAQTSPQSHKLDSLSQVAIRVFSLPSTGNEATQISRQASHLARGTGASEIPYQITQELVLAPSQHKAFPLLAELFSPVPRAWSWSQKSEDSVRNEVARVEAVSPRMLIQDTEYDSPDEAAMDAMPADSAGPAPSISLMTPVVPHPDR